MELHNYIEIARAKQLDLARAYRRAELAGMTRGRHTNSSRGRFARFAFRNVRTNSPQATQQTVAGDA